MPINIMEVVVLVFHLRKPESCLQDTNDIWSLAEKILTSIYSTALQTKDTLKIIILNFN